MTTYNGGDWNRGPDNDDALILWGCIIILIVTVVILL